MAPTSDRYLYDPYPRDEGQLATRDEAVDAVAHPEHWRPADRERGYANISEWRAPTVDDLGILDPAYVQQWIEEAVVEDENLQYDDGGPEVPEGAIDDPHLLAVVAAIRAYLTEHADLSGAAWVPTGRTLRVRLADGAHWIVDQEPEPPKTCPDCGGYGHGPDAMHGGEHDNGACPSCDGTGLAPAAMAEALRVLAVARGGTP